MKYLITDDSNMARKMLNKVLKEFIDDTDEVFLAKNGQEAVDIYKENKPDLCFMDLTMPVLDGFEATLQITQYDTNAKIIVVSADVQQKAMEKAKDNGAIGFVNKPIDSQKMEGILKKLGLI
jgi:two-component system, chemotaxis family, chemotaxis protein CheY